MTWTKSSTSSLKMIIRDLFLIFLLQFEVASCQITDFFAKAGHEVTLPCERASCAGLRWMYSQDQSLSRAEVNDGQVLSSSPRSQRLSLKDDCSLLIKRVTAEDAGYFTCQQDGHHHYNFVLTVMTVKPSSPQQSDLMRDGHVVLECALACYPTNDCRCRKGGLRWMNERNETLSPLRTESNHCVSFLKALAVGRESNYTCQYVLRDDVQVQVQYTAVFTEVDAGGPRNTTEVDAGGPRDTRPPPDRNTLLITIIRAVVIVLMLLILIVVVILVRRKSRRDAVSS